MLLRMTPVKWDGAERCGNDAVTCGSTLARDLDGTQARDTLDETLRERSREASEAAKEAAAAARTAADACVASRWS